MGTSTYGWGTNLTAQCRRPVFPHGHHHRWLPVASGMSLLLGRSLPPRLFTSIDAHLVYQILGCPHRVLVPQRLVQRGRDPATVPSRTIGSVLQVRRYLTSMQPRTNGYFGSPTAWLLSRFIFDVIPLRIIPTIIVSTMCAASSCLSSRMSLIALLLQHVLDGRPRARRGALLQVPLHPGSVHARHDPLRTCLRPTNPR